MAANAVTADRYPDLPTHELASDHGIAGTFVGRITKQGLECSTCGTSDTVTVYQGPQHGPPVGTQGMPVDLAASAEVEITWCTRHGMVGMRVVNADGNHPGQ